MPPAAAQRAARPWCENPGDPQPHTMRLSFTTYSPDDIAEGTRRLAAFAG